MFSCLAVVHSHVFFLFNCVLLWLCSIRLKYPVEFFLTHSRIHPFVTNGDFYFETQLHKEITAQEM